LLKLSHTLLLVITLGSSALTSGSHSIHSKHHT